MFYSNTICYIYPLNRVAIVLGYRKYSRTFQAPSRPFPNLFHPFSARDSFYSINSVSNTNVHHIAYTSQMTAPFFTWQGLLFWNSTDFPGPWEIEINSQVRVATLFTEFPDLDRHQNLIRWSLGRAHLSKKNSQKSIHYLADRQANRYFRECKKGYVKKVQHFPVLSCSTHILTLWTPNTSPVFVIPSVRQILFVVNNKHATKFAAGSPLYWTPAVNKLAITSILGSGGLPGKRVNVEKCHFP